MADLETSPDPEEPETMRLLQGIKGVKRKGWLRAGVPAEDCESVADHTLGCMFLVWKWRMEEPDRLDEVEWALLAEAVMLHDVHEAICGDITPHEMGPRDKRALEGKAKKAIIDGPDTALSDVFHPLFVVI